MPLKVNTMLNCIRVEEVARYLGIFPNTAAMDRLNGDKPWMSPFVEYIPHEAVAGDIVRDDMNEVFEVRSITTYGSLIDNYARDHSAGEEAFFLGRVGGVVNYFGVDYLIEGVRSGGLLLSQIDGPEENFEDLFTDTAVIVQGLVEHGIL